MLKVTVYWKLFMSGRRKKVPPVQSCSHQPERDISTVLYAVSKRRTSQFVPVEQVGKAKEVNDRIFAVVVEFPEKRETHKVSSKSNRKQTLSIKQTHTHTLMKSIFSPWAVSFNLISKLRQKVCSLRKKDKTNLFCEHAECYWLAPRHASAGDFKLAQSATCATRTESRLKSQRFLLRLTHIALPAPPPTSLIHASAHLSFYPLFPHPPIPPLTSPLPQSPLFLSPL